MHLRFPHPKAPTSAQKPICSIGHAEQKISVIRKNKKRNADASETSDYSVVESSCLIQTAGSMLDPAMTMPTSRIISSKIVT